MLATSSRRRPLGRTIVHVALVLALAFGVLAGAGGYWAVIRSTELSHSPYDPAVIAASRTVPRGAIIDREGNVLDPQREGRERRAVSASTAATRSAMSSATPRRATAGSASSWRTTRELSGLAGDPLADALRKFGTNPYDPKDLHLAHVVGPPARRRARARQPARRGRDARPAQRRSPRAGVDARRTTPRRSRTRRPRSARSRRSRTTRPSRSCRAPRSAATCRARCSRSSRRSPASGRARSPPTRRTRSSHRPRRTGCASRGSGSGTATTRRPATDGSTSSRRPRSPAISGTR